MTDELSCAACATRNRPGRRFCAECGAALRVSCGGCGEVNEPGEKYCGGCGAALQLMLSAPDAAPRHAYTPPHLARQILTSRSALEGERKQVTVLFADVKGSMRLAERSGMETWHDILDEFFQVLGEGVHRFDGTVNQYTGDGIMALFGAPIAREDHAQRACFAALYLRERLQQYALDLRRTRGLDFAVRMGLNSGEVVVGKIGDDLRMDYTAQGHTVGLAQRMEQLAAADRVYVTEHVAQRVAGYFELTDLGRFEIKGASEPLRAFELRGVGAMRTRIDVSRARGFSRFVGRAEEMEALRAAREMARGGRGQVVDLVGEPGVGKSRLCVEFLAECRARGCEVHEARAVAHGQSVSYLPVLEFLRSYFGISERDEERVAREKVAGRVLIGDESLRQELPLLFEFLGIRDPSVVLQRLDPEVRLRRQFGAVQKLLERHEGEEARIVLFEDLHWIDGGSEAFLESLVEALRATRTLLIVNFRGEYRPPWEGREHERRVLLPPLAQAAAEELLAYLLGDDESTASLVEKIRRRTAGNPFFIEEVVRSMVERGDLVGERGAYRLRNPRLPVRIPESVQTVLAARIDRLRERDKRILQNAAVIGRHVAEPVLARVIDLPRSELVAGLGALVDAELLVEEEIFPEARYAFQHPLTREVAYGSQLENRRRAVHAAVARAIAAQYADGLHERAALLAYHWDRAGEPLEAARWYRGAARWAGVSDSEQSLSHWRALRTCLARCGESDETRALGLEACRAILNLNWRRALVDEVDAVFEDGRQLAERSGDLVSQAILLNLYGNVRGVVGDLSAYLDCAQRAVAVAERAGDVGVQAVLRLDLAIALFHGGRMRGALDLVDVAAQEDADDPGLGAEVFGWRASTYAAALRGWFASEDGRIAAANRSLARAGRLARLHGEREMQLMVYSLQAYTACVSGETRTALSRARRAVQLGERAGNRAYLAGAWWMAGLANMLAGRWADAAAALERAAGDGFLMSRGRGIANQAEVQLGLGNLVQARSLVDAALRVAVDAHSPRCECYARLTLARVLRRAEGGAAEVPVRAALAASRVLATEMGAAIYEPFLLYEESRLAAALGDGATQRLLHEAALAAFRQVGASGYAAWMEQRRPQS